MKNLSNLIDKNKLYAIYSNVNDSSKFDVGFVLAHDKEWILYELVSPEGNHDGYRIIKSEAIIRLMEDTLYLKRLKGIMDSKQFVRRPILISPDNLFMSVLGYIKSNQIICTAEMLGYGDYVESGLIMNLDDKLFKMEVVSDFGEKDGYMFVDMEDITSISFESCDEFKLSIAAKLRNIK